MLSKEQGITAIGVCAAYDILIHWPGVVRTTLPSAISTSGAGKFTEIPRDYKTVVKRVCKYYHIVHMIIAVLCMTYCCF